jgi:hypothetical protein
VRGLESFQDFIELDRVQMNRLPQFWRMVLESNARTIVAVSQHNEEQETIGNFERLKKQCCGKLGPMLRS